MADRGFNVCEMLGYIGSRLEIPPFTKGESQLPALETEKTRTIAKVRIHVQQVIGSLWQKYYILKQIISMTFLGVSDNATTLDIIVAVSCYLVNFCPFGVLLE